MTKQTVPQLLLAFLAVLATALAGVAAADTAGAATYHETFQSAMYRDGAQTTAMWDTAAGQLRLPAPAPRSEQVLGQLYVDAAWAPAIYEPDSGLVYLFGGWSARDAIQQYDPATNTAVKLPLPLPSALSGSAAVYVESRRAVYLFGGENSDIVVFDLDTQGVTVLQDRLPFVVSHASAVYVPGQDKAYVFGGLSEEGAALGTILQYDLAADTVVALPASLPSAAYMASAIYDPQTESAYIFGGQWQDYMLGLIVQFNVAEGTASTVGWLPVACSGSTAVYVPEQHKAYLFGGARSFAQLLNQVVEFDIASQTATTLDAELPTGLRGAASAYVPTLGKAYILGGQDGVQVLPDVVAYDVNQQVVTDLTVGVDGRGGAAGIYAPGRGKVYLFGGRSGGERTSQSIVSYDLSGRAVHTLPATLPGARADAAAVYNATAQRAYVFGGALLDELSGRYISFYDDVLSFDVAAESVSSSTARLPSGRADMPAVLVPQGKAYLFGGVAEAGMLDEILLYDPVQDTATTLDERLPTAAAGMSAVYEAAVGDQGTVYLFGGWAYGDEPSSVVYYNHIVAFDVATETATLLGVRLPQAMVDTAVITVPGDRTVYVIGGALAGQGLSEIYRFDPLAQTVTVVPDFQLAEGRGGEVAVYVPEEMTVYLFGGNGGRLQPLSGIDMLEFACPLSATAQSLKVSAPGQQVHQALLYAQQSLHGGAVSYALSNNGGQTWASVQPGVKHEFPSVGSDLRWRAVLSGDGRSTPIVEGLTIYYNEVVVYRVFMPVVVRGSNL
jgi:N-acetylneuraminic acid mutarotase